MTFNTNINGVLLSYSTAECPDCGQIPWDGCPRCEGTGQVIAGISTRGASQDITDLLRDGVINTIKAQIKLSYEFNRECQRPDESAKVPVESNESFAARINFGAITGHLPSTMKEMEEAMNRDSSDGPVAGDNGYTPDYDGDDEEIV